MIKHQRPQRRETGFVLVLVLTMLTFITFTMARLATHSLRQAQSAASAERLMRHQWRTLSIQRLALSRAPELLSRLDQGADATARGARFSDSGVNSFTDFPLAMGSQTYHVRVSDESAKLPIGALLAEFDVDRVLHASEELLPAGFRFRAIAPAQAATGFHDLNQIVESNGRATGMPLAVARAAGTNLTLWGPDKLGLRRAHPATIDAMWRVLFQRPAPSRLHQLLQSSGVEGDLLAQLALRESELKLARQWISSQSEHYSVWIIPQATRSAPATICIKWGSGPRASHRLIEF